MSNLSAQERAHFQSVIDDDAAEMLAAIQDGSLRLDANAREEVIQVLEFCCHDGGILPPPSLVKLLRLVAVGPPASKRRTDSKSRVKFTMAAMIVARCPPDQPPSITALRRKAHVSTQATVERWLDDPRFHREVEAWRKYYLGEAGGHGTN